MALATKFYCFGYDTGLKKHDFLSDAWKVMLTATVPNLTDTKDSDITQIASGFGYTTGGSALTVTGFTRSLYVATMAANNLVFTGSGGTMATFRCAVLYNSSYGSAGNHPLAGYWDAGVPVTLTSGRSYTLDLSTGVITIQ